MSKLMTVLGIILLAAGVAIAVIGLVNQAPLLVYNISMPTAIDLIIGGTLAIGLGGVIDALNRDGMAPALQSQEDDAPSVEQPAAAVDAPKAESAESEEPAAKPVRFPSFARKVEETAAPVGAAITATVTAAEEVVTPAVKETITALEQAKTDLEAAMVGTEEPEPHAEGELYVVEDKVVRGRPARILSDGTVEAETDEGWMRFENLEHLDEYLDAVDQA
jgi:hypothetical protein